MSVLRVVLGDQLSENISSLEGCDKKNDLILMCEVIDEATYVKHHKKKIAFLFSAMRHFAQELQQQSYRVIYTKLDDEHNSGSFKGEVQKAIKEHNINKLCVTFPGEYRVYEDILSWEKTFGLPVEILNDNRFMCSLEGFKEWASARKELRMEFFYREMRKHYSILVEQNKPVGGQWNFDKKNRKPLKKDIKIPNPYMASIDSITQDVIELIEKQFPDHFGDLLPFTYAVTRQGALKALKTFIDERLAYFGDYQDALVENNPWLFHSHISLYLNCGLLNPNECINAAISAFEEGTAPLNSVEGFIRQILGWREYIRGIYWLKMPAYKKENTLNATVKLPKFFWDGDTRMNCMKQSLKTTKENAYAHHIQRLMVLGNFLLLCGIEPDEVNEWYLIVYADAYEWVELPNVTGMILFADGGTVASKPYAASGAYINRMSNYCHNCEYNVRKKLGDDACPFNYLYWHFINKHESLLSSNPRMRMIYQARKKMDQKELEQMSQQALEFLKEL